MKSNSNGIQNEQWDAAVRSRGEPEEMEHTALSLLAAVALRLRDINSSLQDIVSAIR